MESKFNICDEVFFIDNRNYSQCVTKSFVNEIKYGEPSLEIKYRLYNCGDYFKEKQLFKTFEEARDRLTQLSK